MDKSRQPHNLTGPLLVNQGVTLIIEAGATVNLNGYEIRINGTLRAMGSATEKIHITNIQRIEFTEFSEGWNEQTGSGCSFKHLTSEGSIVVSDSIINGDVYIGHSSEILNNTINGWIMTYNNITGGLVSTGNSVITNNNIEEHLYSGNNSVISYNTIGGIVHGGEVTNNNITGTYVISEDTVNNVHANTVINNTIIGRVTTEDSGVVSNNYIKGNYTKIYEHLVHYTGFRGSIGEFFGGVDVSEGSPLISNNVIDGGITGRSGSSPIILNNTVLNSGIYIPRPLSDNPDHYSGSVNLAVGPGDSPEIYGNTVDGIIKVEANSSNVSGNTATGIEITEGSIYVYNNTVNDGEGIFTLNVEGVIEGNYLSNNEHGIRGYGSTEL
jgi:hypothetical protein